jgi:hypothetical protein
MPTDAVRNARAGLPARIAFAAIRRGDRLGPAEIAWRAGMITDAVGAELRLLAGAGEANLDEQGRVIAVAGLSVTPAAHELVLDASLSTPGAPGMPSASLPRWGRTPRCVPAGRWCGRPIEVVLSRGGEVGDASVLLWLPGSPLGYDENRNPQLVWCPRANLFCGHDHLASWRHAHGDPRGEAITPVEAVRRGAERWARFRTEVA